MPTHYFLGVAGANSVNFPANWPWIKSLVPHFSGAEKEAKRKLLFCFAFLLESVPKKRFSKLAALRSCARFSFFNPKLFSRKLVPSPKDTGNFFFLDLTTQNRTSVPSEFSKLTSRQEFHARKADAKNIRQANYFSERQFPEKLVLKSPALGEIELLFFCR